MIKASQVGFSHVFHLVKGITTTNYNGFGLCKVDSQERITKFVVKTLLLYLSKPSGFSVDYS